jgi:hypothetical protein
MKLRALLFAALLLPAPAFGEDQQFKNGEAVSIQPDKAYLLARTFEMPGKGLQGTVRVAPILIRVLSDEELRQAEALFQSDPKHWKEKSAPNVVEMLPGEPYAQAKGEVTMLTAVKPGTYILAGVAAASWAMKSIGMMTASLCMGTVKFEAKAGVVTDLGAILAAYDDEPTAIPELAKVVTGKSNGITSGFGPYPYTVAVRPAGAATAVPGTLGNLPRAPADYRAMRAFPNYAGAPISRLAPLPGVLDYDKEGEVLAPGG